MMRVMLSAGFQKPPIHVKTLIAPLEDLPECVDEDCDEEDKGAVDHLNEDDDEGFNKVSSDDAEPSCFPNDPRQVDYADSGLMVQQHRGATEGIKTVRLS
jgi:hypothetical protein